jgi:hypothetical protein
MLPLEKEVIDAHPLNSIGELVRNFQRRIVIKYTAYIDNAPSPLLENGYAKRSSRPTFDWCEINERQDPNEDDLYPVPQSVSHRGGKHNDSVLAGADVICLVPTHIRLESYATSPLEQFVYELPQGLKGLLSLGHQSFSELDKLAVAARGRSKIESIA